MSSGTNNLSRIQRWMQNVIMHPEGIVEGIRSDESRGLIDVSPEDVEQVITRSNALTSVERLQVYGNAYYARLLECVREEFPSLLHAVGEEAFDGFAFGYLQKYPSRSYTLAELGRNFPGYLEETRPNVAEEERPDWADFLIDLATLERTYSDVFHGPGTEQKRILQTEDLQTIPPEHWPEVKLVPVECLRLMTFHYPVHEYATAVRKHQAPSPPEPMPTDLVVTRRDYIVRRCAVSMDEFAILSALVSGQTIGEAIGTVAARDDCDVESLSSNLQTWFHRWAAAAYFESVEMPE